MSNSYGVGNDNKLNAIVFEGGQYNGEISRWMSLIREEMAINLCAKLHNSQEFEKIIFCTNRVELASKVATRVPEIIIHIFSDGEEQEKFHFGKRLYEVIKEHKLNSFIYLSGGSGQLMDVDDIRYFSFTTLHAYEKGQSSTQRYIVANNAHSADMFGILDTSHIFNLNEGFPETDNEFVMWYSLNFDADIVTLPSEMAFQFDVDTPIDSLIMSINSKSAISIETILSFCENQRLSEAIKDTYLKINMANYVMNKPGSEFSIIGRVPPHSVLYLNSILRCRTRVFSEERGMRSLRRDINGETKSILASYINRCGIRNFVSDFSEITQLAFIDTRVLFNSLGCMLSEEERFASDLFMTEYVKNKVACELIGEFKASSCNFICGGHCLVSWGVRTIALYRQVHNGIIF